MTKRFYKQTDVAKSDEGYSVTLDGRAIKTPAGKALFVPTEPLAKAVAAEWDAQGDEIDPNAMPLMQLCGTAIDRIPGVRDGLIDGLLRYVDTDLLCYRAETPEDLARRQAEVWQPLLDWAEETFGAKLQVVTGIIPVTQDDQAKQGFGAAMAGLNDWELTALAEMVGICGSIVVGFAMFAGALDAEQAFKVCHVDEDHQIALWGEDGEATVRRENTMAELNTAAEFLGLMNA